ncbi:DUF4405 domain-containing protein [Caldisericum exile]|uniref:Flavinylation-associated cytochrome domain-containing protein n=1 Tax=Caldisericum exile (strain DSM 21853 / NBRC 104410 / AZM16c01) TaxID=511051 RepID=A0A7U6JFM2_CALEA|nr:DUF4405 domain-containing protein [Caldisericum exile]BAL80315.1 hypothetical protein CSE_01890 [Caldisericum exile AZM16c01]
MNEKRRVLNINMLIVKIKGIISTLIFLLFVPVAFSGIGLYFAPSGREARLTNWTFLGFSKDALETMHSIPGLIFSALIVIHLLLNFRIYKNEIICLLRTK